MANFRRKSFIKIKVLFFLFCVSALSFTIAVNIILSTYKNAITNTLNNNFFKPVAVKNIFYLPPNFIILKGVDILEGKTTPDKKIFSLPVSIASVSLSEFFLNKNLYILSFYSLGADIDSGGFLSLIKDSFGQILESGLCLPKQDFVLSLRRITIQSARLDNHPVKTRGDFNLKINGAKVFASVSLGENNLILTGLLAPDQLTVENFKLTGPKINCQLWGELNPKLAELKGFVLMNASESPGKPKAMKVFILDIDSRIKLNSPRIEIEHLDFSVNNLPLKLTGEISLDEPFGCNLKLISDFKGKDNKENNGIKNIHLIAKVAAKKRKTFTLDGSFNIDFLEDKKDLLPLEKLEFNVKDLIFNFNNPSVLKINAGKIYLSSKTSSNSYNIDLAGLNGEIYELNKPVKLIKFSSPFYGGLLKARGYLEMHRFIPKISAVIRIKDASAHKLESILAYFSKTYGKLSGQISFVNYPQLTSKGSIFIKNGYLDNFEFFKWLADLFNLPSLKTIYFDTANFNFIADKEGAEMNHLKLDSENLKIEGYFKLRANDLVSSKIYLSFGKRLLQKSDKLRPLLKLINTEQELVKFNFQLSGNLHAMNFQWLQSGFKDDLEKAIPDSRKKGFEDKVNLIIESLLKK